MDYHIFYRGQSDKKYGLLPSIYREEALIQNEDKIFRDIIAQCPTDFKGSTSTFEKLVKMQHYSLPTRLLDITTNPLVALYFACDNNEVDGMLFRFEVKTSEFKYFDSDAVSVVSNIAKRPIDFSIENLRDLDCEDFNSQPDIAYLLHEIKYEKPHFQNIIDSKDIERVFCVKPMFDNPRIIRQSGAFFLYGIDGDKSKPAKLALYAIKGMVYAGASMFGYTAGNKIAEKSVDSIRHIKQNKKIEKEIFNDFITSQQNTNIEAK